MQLHSSHLTTESSRDCPGTRSLYVVYCITTDLLSMNLLSTKRHFMMRLRFTTTSTMTMCLIPTIRHNEVRDITAHLMSDVWHNVGLEQTLQPITG